MVLLFSTTQWKRTLLKDAKSIDVLILLILISEKLQNLFLIIIMLWLQIMMPKPQLLQKEGNLLQWQLGTAINRLLWILKILTSLKKQKKEETMTLMSWKIKRPERVCITPCKHLIWNPPWAQEQIWELPIEKNEN